MEKGEAIIPEPEFNPQMPLSKSAKKNAKRRDKSKQQREEDNGASILGKARPLRCDELVAEGEVEMPRECAFWRSTGRCKFGTSCRFWHGETLASRTDNHPHLLGPGVDAAGRRRKAFCDECDQKTQCGWKCTDGCDYVLCAACMEAHRLPVAPVAEGAAESPAVSSDSIPHNIATGAPDGRTAPEGRLHYVTGDATTVSHGRGFKVIAHVCNDLGRWGKGFVMAVSAKWPDVADQYRRWHQSRDEGFRLGAIQTVTITESMCANGKARAALLNAAGGLAVANIIGQHGIKMGSGGPPVRYEAIGEGLLTLGARVVELAGSVSGVPSVHMPRIGAGLAGGQWTEIEPLILRMLAASPSLEAYVYDWDG